MEETYMQERIERELADIIKMKIDDDMRHMKITKATRLREDLLIDSMVFYDLLIELEKAFDIMFSVLSPNASEFKSVGSLSEYINLLFEEKQKKEDW